MEGKALVFKRFAGIDCFDIEVDATDVESFVETVARTAVDSGAATRPYPSHYPLTSVEDVFGKR